MPINTKNVKLLQDYNEIFKEQLVYHITEKISEDESKKISDIEIVHYLPHHLVIKEERETVNQNK